MPKIKKEVRRIVLKRDGYKCTDCGTPGTKKNKLTMHHIRFRRHGGTNDPWNLRTLCQRCHNALHKMFKRGPKRRH